MPEEPDVAPHCRLQVTLTVIMRPDLEAVQDVGSFACKVYTK